MNCEKGKKIRPHPPGSQTEAHIQCSLWKRAVPPRVRSSPSILSLHLPPPLYSSFFSPPYFSYIHSPLQHIFFCISFIWLSPYLLSESSRIPLWTSSQKTLGACPRHSSQKKKKNWNSGPEAETGEDQSSPMNNYSRKILNILVIWDKLTGSLRVCFYAVRQRCFLKATLPISF